MSRAANPNGRVHVCVFLLCFPYSFERTKLEKHFRTLYREAPERLGWGFCLRRASVFRLRVRLALGLWQRSLGRLSLREPILADCGHASQRRRASAPPPRVREGYRCSRNLYRENFCVCLPWDALQRGNGNGLRLTKVRGRERASEHMKSRACAGRGFYTAGQQRRGASAHDFAHAYCILHTWG